ncbi:MAG: hypothetical protein IKX23_03875 [Treponema sp.]|nr:hypothetical protein [Treponema sp.]
MKKLITILSAFFIAGILFTGCKESIDIPVTKDDINLTDGTWKATVKEKENRTKKDTYNSTDYYYSYYSDSKSTILLTIENGLILDICYSADLYYTVTFTEDTPEGAITDYIKSYKDSYWTRNGYILKHEIHEKDSHDSDITGCKASDYISAVIEDGLNVYTNKNKTKYKITSNGKEGYSLYNLNYMLELQ